MKLIKNSLMRLNALIPIIVFPGLLAASGFDSSNVRLLGAWPFGPARGVAVDETRKLAFIGSGGAILDLEVNDPTNPTLVSKAL